MNSLIGLVAEYVGDQVQHNLKKAVSPVAPYLRGLAMGVGFVVLSWLAFSLVLLLLGVAMFTGFAGYSNLVSASLWTALPFAVIGIIFLVTGLGLLRRPR